MVFRRKFSVNLRKNLRFPLGEMSLYTDWVNSKRGDAYPIVTDGGISDSVLVDSASYRAENPTEEGTARRRLLGQHFPYANYEFTICALDGSAGFSFICKAEANSVYTAENAPSMDIAAEGNEESGYSLVCNIYEGGKATRSEKTDIIPELKLGTVFSVSARGEEFDVFATNDGGAPMHIHTFVAYEFDDIRRQDNFQA